jgi:hypothetical protein
MEMSLWLGAIPKLMRYFIFTLIFTAFLSATGFAQAEKMLVKSIDLNGNSSLTAILNGAVSVSEWDKDYIRVTTKIELLNFNNSILDKLVTAGRYEIELKNDNGTLSLTMPKTQKDVLIKGILLEEHLSYEISIPKNLEIKTEQILAEGL